MRTSKRFRRSVSLAVVTGTVIGSYWLFPPKVISTILIGLFSVLSVLIEPLLDLAMTLVSEE
jgi:hypothetical protein